MSFCVIDTLVYNLSFNILLFTLEIVLSCDLHFFPELIKRDVPGFAIGGLSGGEEKSTFWKMVSISTQILPKEKPRYLMGVG